MEGVGARLGRSSTRYGGPATVFSGPVRKWMKKWVQAPSPSSNNSVNHAGTGNGGANNGSHLVLYKWTPITSSNGNGNGAPATPAAAGGKEAESTVAAEEPPRRKFRYVPVSVIEEQKQEAAAKAEDDAKPSDSDASLQPQNGNLDSKPGINDISMEEAKASGKDKTAPPGSGDSNLDLNLGLKAHDVKSETDPKYTSQTEGTSGTPAPDLEMRV